MSARSLFSSYQHTIARLSAVLHPPRPRATPLSPAAAAAPAPGSGQKLLFQNTLGVARLDNFAHFDGCFSEGGLPVVNPTAFLSVAAPATVWVYPTFSAKLTARVDADRFLQIYLLMGVLPMAPVPGNDHAILPNITTAAVFQDYGPLFRAVAGAVWELGQIVADVSVAVVRSAAGGKGCRNSGAPKTATDPTPAVNVFAPPRSRRPGAPSSFLVVVSAAAYGTFDIVSTGSRAFPPSARTCHVMCSTVRAFFVWVPTGACNPMFMPVPPLQGRYSAQLGRASLRVKGHRGDGGSPFAAVIEIRVHGSGPRGSVMGKGEGVVAIGILTILGHRV